MQIAVIIYTSLLAVLMVSADDDFDDGHFGSLYDQWAQWSHWGRCSKTCGGGIQTRTRTCVTLLFGCYGYGTQTLPCATTKCPGVWSQWGPWGKCSVTCGSVGWNIHFRTCLGGVDVQCPGRFFEAGACYPPHCPVNGQWGAWNHWATCSKSCGTGTKTRTRACNNPAPSHGGAQCPESSSQSQNCNTRLCPVNGRWGPWAQWATCSKTCGTGIRTRTRACDNPAPSNGGAPCKGTGEDSSDCNTNGCPVDGQWGPWMQWGECSKTCGTGSKVRTRSCNSPAPSHGGAPCEGSGSESTECSNTQPCPVDGQWGSWTEWDTCSKTCGTGSKVRTRSCNSPAPSHGGAPCDGEYVDSKECSNTQPCPEAGSDYKKCKVIRDCDFPHEFCIHSRCLCRPNLYFSRKQNNCTAECPDAEVHTSYTAYERYKMLSDTMDTETLHNSTLEDCRQKCHGLSQCGGFTMFPQNQRCTFHRHTHRSFLWQPVSGGEVTFYHKVCS